MPDGHKHPRVAHGRTARFPWSEKKDLDENPRLGTEIYGGFLGNEEAFHLGLLAIIVVMSSGW